MMTAIVIGATGLVGTQLVQNLLQDNRFGKVKVFVRRTTSLKNIKLEEHIISFDESEQWRHLVTGDVLFSALGTTLKTAGSKEAQYKIDYTYQYNFAEAAANNGVPTYVLVSSAGADANASIFYSRMKGELETAVKKLPFQHINIIQPGILKGERKEKRLGETIGIALLSVLQLIPGLGKFKPIEGSTVAAAMINAALQKAQKIKVYSLSEVFNLAAVSV